MDFTLWRGSTLLGRGELQEGKRPGILHGPIYRTSDLDLLGPIAQHRFPGFPIMQSALPRASEWVQHSSNQGDLDVIELVISDSNPSSRAPQELSSDQLLTVRSADGNEIATDMISVMAPPELPAEVMEHIDAVIRERLKLWRMTCHVSSDDPNPASSWRRRPLHR